MARRESRCHAMPNRAGLQKFAAVAGTDQLDEPCARLTRHSAPIEDDTPCARVIP
jgi:hypothetical protein